MSLVAYNLFLSSCLSRPELQAKPLMKGTIYSYYHTQSLKTKLVSMLGIRLNIGFVMSPLYHSTDKRLYHSPKEEPIDTIREWVISNIQPELVDRFGHKTAATKFTTIAKLRLCTLLPEKWLTE